MFTEQRRRTDILLYFILLEKQFGIFNSTFNIQQNFTCLVH